MANLWGKSLTRNEILRRVGDIHQLAKAEPFELCDGPERGVRGVRLFNAAGLDMTIAADRGMAITDLTLSGTPLPFFTPAGTVNPAFYEPEGVGWLRSWPGGFLTPCGLTQVGTPVLDGSEALGLHGRAASTPAREVRWGGSWNKDEYLLWVEGLIVQTAMFAEKISLRRRIWTWLGDTRFWIEDTVENLDFKPVPFMFLNHFNLGYPLVDAGARLELPPHPIVPVDESARAGLDRWMVFEDPQPNTREQVYYHELVPSADGNVEVRLSNPGFDNGKGLGILWRYAYKDYPVLVEWKLMDEGNYVVGIEPANCHVEGRLLERSRGTLVTLQPQETRRLTMEISFFR